MSDLSKLRIVIECESGEQVDAVAALYCRVGMGQVVDDALKAGAEVLITDEPR